MLVLVPGAGWAPGFLDQAALARGRSAGEHPAGQVLRRGICKGTGRTLTAQGRADPCWSRDGQERAPGNVLLTCRGQSV